MTGDLISGCRAILEDAPVGPEEWQIGMLLELSFTEVAGDVKFVHVMFICVYVYMSYR